MLAGIYYGAQYGGSTTAILINVPGEAASVVTAIDGYQMARTGPRRPGAGRGGPGLVLRRLRRHPDHRRLRAAADRTRLQVRPGGVLLLMVLGLIGAVVLASGSLIKAIAHDPARPAAGADQHRRHLRRAALQLRHPRADRRHRLRRHRDGRVRLRRDHRQPGPAGRAPRGLHQGRQGPVADASRTSSEAWPAVLRGTALGSVLGVLPGGGALLSCFAAYTLEKKLAGKDRRVPFGQGDIRGVAGPESANNAGAQTSFIPMLTLGIPPNAVMALMVGAMTIKGIQPGPQVMTSNPELFWGLIASRCGSATLMLIDPEPAADRHLDQAADGALPLPVPGHHGVLLHRPVHAEQQQLRRLHGGAASASSAMSSTSSAASRRRCCWASSSGR